jgi:hypothetical protein
VVGHICLLEIRGQGDSAVEDDFSCTAEVSTSDPVFVVLRDLCAVTKVRFINQKMV